MYKYKVAAFSPQASVVQELKELSEVDPFLDKYAVTWLDCAGLSKDDIDEVGKRFGLHKLALEDCFSKRQRTKVDDYKDYSFIILKAIENHQHIRAYQIGIFVGKNYLITIGDKCSPCFGDLFNRIIEKSPKLTESGTDFLCYEIIDMVVDDFFPILDRIEKEIEVVEEESIEKYSKKTVGKIFTLRKELLAFRKVVWPTREMVIKLEKEDLPNFNEKNKVYYRDVYDHVVWITDMIENYRELLSSVLETYLSSISNNLNEIMKVLTVITSLLLLPNLIASIYGTNFENLPGKELDYGFEAMLFLMAFMVAVMLFFFKRKKWI